MRFSYTLNDVLLDPKTGTIYTPNTNAYAKMGSSPEKVYDGNDAIIASEPLTGEENGSIIENRGWVTIRGRRVLLNKDGGSGGGSSSGKAESAVSAYGVNKFAVRQFRSKSVANNHLQKHKKELNEIGIKTIDEYLDAALTLAESACDGKDILGFIYPDGRLVRYKAKTKLFVVGRPSKGIYSCFVADRKNYFEEEFAKRDTSQEK